jgi:hypothetical protein
MRTIKAPSACAIVCTCSIIRARCECLREMDRVSNLLEEASHLLRRQGRAETGTTGQQLQSAEGSTPVRSQSTEGPARTPLRVVG